MLMSRMVFASFGAVGVIFLATEFPDEMEARVSVSKINVLLYQTMTAIKKKPTIKTSRLLNFIENISCAKIN